MAKGSNGRRAARASVPRTIDLTAQAVEAKPAPDVPPAEPVAFDVFSERKAESVAGSQADTPAQETAAEEAAMTGPEPASPSGPRSETEPAAAPRMRAGPLVAAALAGGLAGLAFLAILGATGILRDIAQLGAPQVEDTISPRVDALEARLAGTPDHQAAIDALAARLDAAEKALAERAPDPASGGDDDDRLVELTAQVEALETRLATAEAGLGRTQDGAPAADPAQSAAASAAFEQRLRTIAADNDGQDRTLEAIEARIAALEVKVAAGLDARGETDAREDAAKRMAADALVSAYRRGEPFTDLLGSLATVADAPPDLAALQAPAAEGVATDAELAAQFKALAGKIVAADATQPAGLVDRFLANARSLVEVRPAGPVEGSDPAAIVSRIEAQLSTGSLGPALAEWQALPPAGKSVSQEWATRLEVRIAADKALGDLLATLGRPAAVAGQ